MSVADIWRVSLVTLSPSEAGPGRFGRQLYFTIALSLLCANPHLHVRATTREAARPQPQGSEDTTGYWAADSLVPSPLSLFLPFSPAPSVLAR